MEQNERIATLESQLDSLSKGMDRIETKLDAYSANFLSRNEADIRFKNIEDEVKEMKDNKKSNNALIVSCISIGITLVFAIASYYKNGGI